jgi:hypothetical protein
MTNPDPKPESIVAQLEQMIEQLMEELLMQQNRKVLDTARLRLPHLTGDDILNPHDFPELMADPIFNYEEGIAAGYLAALIALRARVLRPWLEHAQGIERANDPPR